MRKPILFLVAILSLMVSTSAFAINEPQYANYHIKRGTGGNPADAARTVRLVRYGQNSADGATVNSGDAVVWSTISDDGITVNHTTTSADGAFAGIACVSIQSGDVQAGSAYDDVGRRNWGWIVVDGYVRANVSAGGTNAHTLGDAFITSTDAGRITASPFRANATQISVSEISKMIVGKGGFFFDSVTAANTVEDVYVKAE